MKPTEQDIQAELDRHGLGRATFTRQSDSLTLYFENSTVWFDMFGKFVEVTIGSNTPVRYPFDQFGRKLGHKSCPNTTGWWGKHVSVLRSIWRLITGEQVEQSLEEKVREILEPLGVNEFDFKPDCVSFQLIASGRKIYRDSYVTINERGEEQSYPLDNVPIASGWRSRVKQVAALLTEQPEQTLEEAVRGILGSNNSSRVTIPNFVSYTTECVVLRFGSGSTETVFNDATVQLNNGPRVEIEKYNVYEEYKSVLLAIAALLATRSTKPSYSDLEQRVEELEEQVADLTVVNSTQQKEYENVYKLSRKKSSRITQLDEWLKNTRERADKLERENASLLDKFGPIDQAEQQVAEVETRFQKLAKRAERIADLLIQLNEEIL